MRPRMLKIKGLNSFIEEQNIDFETLTERGLFGIFGPTGSGKSTILDAITLALYGEISRNTKEFVNSEADMLGIGYEFSIRNGNDIHIYAVERSFKRTEDGIRKSKDARLYRKSGEDDVDIIAEGIMNVTNEIQGILGLSAEDFTRSVVLPQGKFNEFLKLTGSDRRNMLERIFGLEKYGRGLTEKIKGAKNERSIQLADIESKLTVYGDLSKEQYEEQKKLYDMLIEEEKVIRNEINTLNNEYEKYQVIWELQQELLSYEEKNKELKEQNDSYLNNKIIVDNAKKAEIIKPVIDELDKIQKNKQDSENKINTLQVKLNAIEKEIKEMDVEYSKALKRKNMEHPILMEKEANLNQAVQMLEDKKDIEEQRNTLRVEFSKNKNRIEIDSKTEDEIKKQIKALEEGIQKIEEEKNQIAIDPSFREEIEKGYEIEKEYIKIKDNEKELKNKLENLKSQILNSKSKYEVVIKQKDEKWGLLSKATETLNDLKANSPGNNETIFKQHKYVEELKSEYTRLDEQIKQKCLYEKNFDTIIAQAKDKETIKEKLHNEKEVLKHKSEELQKFIEDTRRKNMAAVLAKDLKEGENCPVCGSTHHIHIDFDLDENSYNFKLEEEKELISQVQKVEEAFNKVSLELAGINNEANKIKTEIDAINSVIGKEDMNGLKKQISQEEVNLEKLQKEIKNWEKDISEGEKSLGELKESFNILEREEVRLKEGLDKDEAQYKEISEQYKEVKKRLKELLNKYTAIKKQYNLETIEDQIKQIRAWDKKRITLEREEKDLRESLKRKEVEKDNISKLITQLEQENAKILQSGIEKKEMIDKWNEQIMKLSENKDPFEYREEIRNKIKDILESEEKLKNSLENLKNEKQHIEQENLKMKTYYETLTESYIEENKKLNTLLQQHHFLTSEEVMKAWLEEDKKEALERFVSQFEESVKEVKNNMLRIKSKLNEESISNEAWENLKLHRQEKTLLLERKNKEIAVLEEKLNIMSKNLEAVIKLNQQKKSLDHTFSLLDDLYKLVMGNKFVEFVASARLKYIAKEASKTLKEITRGRYALELDGTGNFIMRDDFNGGIRRSANTLSGGETFLTSLSLALALSSQIQLNNSAPLEFFFLDEGFGTLDNNLLDVVMTALEKLHSQQLSVGIISHVEELKNRIPVKLVVEPAKQGLGGSKVHIEYS